MDYKKLKIGDIILFTKDYKGQICIIQKETYKILKEGIYDKNLEGPYLEEEIALENLQAYKFKKISSKKLNKIIKILYV